ncbi:MAG: formate/nitrite transporter family protein [Clostridia bacterium]|nr:formate/nitrite transporter family protein [Clostridia bacterium]
MKSPAEIAQNYIKVAQGKTTQKWYKLLTLAVLAGAFIAFGAAVATTAGAYASNAALVKGLVFPVGLILVVVCGSELFTGNCLLISPLIGKDIKVGGFFKNLGIVYAGNFLGGLLIAVFVVYSHVQNQTVAEACVAAAALKSNMGFGEALLRGILCNMLVCLAVWASMASSSTAGKILAMYLPVLAFVVCGFEHSVANMYYLSAGLMAGVEYGITAAGLTVGNALLYCLLPSTIGNIIGGFLIGGAYHTVYRTKMPKAEQ